MKIYLSLIILLSFNITILKGTETNALRNLGTIKITNGLVWDHPQNGLTNFNIYLSNVITNEIKFTNNIEVITNSFLIATNYAKVASVITNSWSGDATKQWFGIKAVFITAALENDVESDPSEKVLLNFRAGIPVPPTNIQLYNVIIAAATNALPPFP